MIWSFSTHRQFRKCQRQWFYKNLMANALAKKDPLRREAYILSNLKSISAWRGSIVDDAIGKFIIPKILKKEKINPSDILKLTKKLCREQYDFALNKKYRIENITKSSIGAEFTAFYAVEYDIQISNAELKTAWQEIETSIKNFLENSELIEYLKEAQNLITQRALLFNVNGFNVRGVPDLIVFFADKPPHIFDWKVHAFGTKAYDEQLLIYALALKRCNPHKDFPVGFSKLEITDIKISEYQLLKNTIREYPIKIEYIEATEELIAESTLQMYYVGAHKKYSELSVNDFTAARFPESCETCSFKKLCWEA